MATSASVSPSASHSPSTSHSPSSSESPSASHSPSASGSPSTSVSPSASPSISASGVLSVQRPLRTGAPLLHTAVTASDGDAFKNTGKEFVSIINSSGGPITVTFKSGKYSNNKCSFGLRHSDHDLVVSIADSQTKMIGPFNKSRFNDSDGMLTFVCSNAASVTAAVISQS